MDWDMLYQQRQCGFSRRRRVFEETLDYNLSKDMTAMIALANQSRDSGLLRMFVTEKVLRTTAFALNALITSVCRGDLDVVRAALAKSRSDGDAVAKTDEPLPASEYGSHQDKFARSTPKKTIPVERAPVTSQSAAACCTNATGERQTAGANFMCPITGLSLLHYAVLANQQEIIRLLLENGADPNRVTENSLPNICHWSNICVTPLHVAAYLRNLESVFDLIESGARVTKSLWQYLHVPKSHGGSGKILQFLLHDGRYFLPVIDAIAISANSENPISLLVRSAKCRWTPDYDRPDALLLMLRQFSGVRDLLRTKAYTAKEKLVKTCYMQYLLLCVCYFNPARRRRYPDLNNDILTQASLSLLDVLISEGANPLGWSVRQVKIMNAAWEQLVDPESVGHMKSRTKSPFTSFGLHITCCGNIFYGMRLNPDRGTEVNNFSPPCLHPAVVRVVVHGMRENDPVAERLVQLANQRAPCVLQTPQQARYAYGCPEKGPRCTNASLPEEQKRAPLRMCSYAFSHVPSLSARCRDVILCVLPEKSFLQSVRDLPLPEKIKWYIISG